MISTAIVTEERIFKSGKNIRTDLTSIRKATEADDAAAFSRILENGNCFHIKHTNSYIHIHSNKILTIILRRCCEELKLKTDLVTISDYFDDIEILYEGDGTAEVYTVSC